MVLFQIKKRLGKIIPSWTTLHSTTPEQNASRMDWKVICLQMWASGWRLPRNLSTKWPTLILIAITTKKKKLNLKVGQADCTRIKNQSCRNVRETANLNLHRGCTRRFGVTVFASPSSWPISVRAEVSYSQRCSLPSSALSGCTPLFKAELAINEKQGTKGI